MSTRYVRFFLSLPSYFHVIVATTCVCRFRIYFRRDFETLDNIATESDYIPSTSRVIAASPFSGDSAGSRASS